MKIVNSYKAKIINANDVFKGTIFIYRKAISYLIKVIDDNYSSIKELESKAKNNYIESLIHKTKRNPSPKYDFDERFYKFPSYFRRTAIQDALGIVSSYYSNLENYNDKRYEYISNGKKFKEQPPRLSLKHFKNPVFYKNNMFNRLSDGEVQIKIFHKNDWIWFNCKLRNQDIKYILNNTKDSKELNPSLIKEGRKYYLQFPYKKDVKLNTETLEEQTIISVDLGVNTSAVCSAIRFNGTVVDRVFINQPTEKDRLYRLTNRLMKIQRKSGRKAKLPNLWRKINNLNNEITNDTVSKIIKFALKNNASTIVFEYLGAMPKVRGKRSKRIRVKLRHWAKIKIQNKVEHKAHSFGIRFSRVNARNTSKLAYDGSGEVKRDKKNFSICTFTTGKVYNCDLNASYNIGARYYIREILKSYSEKDRLQLKAKVPLVGNRTKCTLSTLISITKVA